MTANEVLAQFVATWDSEFDQVDNTKLLTSLHSLVNMARETVGEDAMIAAAAMRAEATRKLGDGEHVRTNGAGVHKEDEHTRTNGAGIHKEGDVA